MPVEQLGSTNKTTHRTAAQTGRKRSPIIQTQGTPCASLYFLVVNLESMAEADSSADARHRVRVFVDFWNYALHMRNVERRFRTELGEARASAVWRRSAGRRSHRHERVSGTELLRLLQSGQRNGPKTPPMGNGSRGHVPGGEGVNRSQAEEAVATSVP